MYCIWTWIVYTVHEPVYVYLYSWADFGGGGLSLPPNISIKMGQYSRKKEEKNEEEVKENKKK